MEDQEYLESYSACHRLKGHGPLHREKYASVVTDTGLYFRFGGFDEDGSVDTTVYILNLSTKEWETRPSSELREGHSATYIGNNKVLIFGGIITRGKHEDRDERMRQLVVYDISTDNWDYPVQSCDMKYAPRSIRNHAACIDDRGLLYVSGGSLVDLECDDESYVPEPECDLYVYSLPLRCWLPPKKNVFCRFSHSIVFFHKRLYAIGGIARGMKLTSDLISVGEPQFNDETIHNILNCSIVGGQDVFQTPLLPDHFIVFDSNNACVHFVSPLNSTKRTLNLLSNWTEVFVNGEKLYFFEEELGWNQFSTIDIDVEALRLETIPSNTKKNQFSQNYRNFLKTGEFTDFEIRGVISGYHPPESAEFTENSAAHDSGNGVYMKSDPLRVHRAILLANWPYFRKLVRSNMSESMSGQLFIPEPVAWIQAFIEYLYTGELTIQGPVHTAGVLYMAHLYDLKELEDQCWYTLRTTQIPLEELIDVYLTLNLIGGEEGRELLDLIYRRWGTLASSGALDKYTREVLIQLFVMLSPESCKERGNSRLSRDWWYSLDL